MFFGNDLDRRREIAVNLLGNSAKGRSQFLKEEYGVSRSEISEIRKRLYQAMEALPSGRPHAHQNGYSIGPCAGCQEKDALIDALKANYAAERERGRRELILQAAVLPVSTASIPDLEWAAFRKRSSKETIRTTIQAACDRAVELMNSFPWAEFIHRLTADELFAGRVPILDCVEPRSMAVPVLQRGPDRTAETWEEVFKRFPNLEVVASDQGPGILGAAEARKLQSQADLFHCNDALRDCLRALERQAYRYIREEYAAEKGLKIRQAKNLPCKRAEQQYTAARKRALKEMERFDRAIQAKPLFKQAMSPFDEEGRWRSHAASIELIHGAIAILQEVEAPYRKKVANAFNVERALTFKAIIEAPLVFDKDLSSFDPVELINVAVTMTCPRPTDPEADLVWILAAILDQKLTATCPTWPAHRARIQDEIQNLFRSSSWSEAINDRIRAAQQVLKHLGGKFLVLLALVHNATKFRGGKRRGKSPFEILGMKTPPGTWIDWVSPK